MLCVVVRVLCDIRRASGISDYLLSNLPPSDGKTKPLSPTIKSSVVPAQPDAPPKKPSKQAADIVTDMETKCTCG